MHYTSGTTGRPKGVTTGIWDEATARAVFEDEASVWHFDRRDLHLVCSPMYHTVSVRFCSGTLLSGGALAILSRFDAADRARCPAPRAPDDGVPRPDPPASGSCRPRPRAATSASTRCASWPMPARPARESVKRAIMARVRPGGVWEFYGSTEAQFTVCSPEEWLERPGTVGRARPGRRLSIAPVARGGRR